MKVTFDRGTWPEYLAWQCEDAKVAELINVLVGECLRNPFRGTGSPSRSSRT